MNQLTTGFRAAVASSRKARLASPCAGARPSAARSNSGRLRLSAPERCRLSSETRSGRSSGAGGRFWRPGDGSPPCARIARESADLPPQCSVTISYARVRSGGVRCVNHEARADTCSFRGRECSGFCGLARPQPCHRRLQFRRPRVCAVVLLSAAGVLLSAGRVCAAHAHNVRRAQRRGGATSASSRACDVVLLPRVERLLPVRQDLPRRLGARTGAAPQLRP